MSELEKRQRDEYQKNRKKLINIQIVIAVILLLATMFTLIPYIIMNENTYVSYSEDGKTESRMYLEDNTFYDELYLDSNHAYVSELIKYIETDFKYALQMDADKVEYKYSYKIIATVTVTDRDSKAPLFDPSFVIKDVQNAESSESKLYINEKVSINYDDYNDLAQSYVDQFGLNTATAALSLRMNVSVIGESETLAENKNNNYSMEVTIPLLRQTIKLTSQSSVPTGEQRILACNTEAKTVLKVLWIVFAILTVLLFIFIICFIILTRDKHIDYSRRVQKLMSSYKSYIQRISNPFDFAGFKVLNVVTFEELLEIGDKLGIPVLMYENEDKTRSEFFVVSSAGIIYLYVVEVEDDEDEAIPALAFVDKTAEINAVETVEFELEAEPEIEPVAEIEVEAEPEVEPAAEIEVEAELEVEPAAEIEVEAEPEVEAVAAIAVEAEPEIEAVAEIEVEAEPEVEPAAKIKVEAEPEIEPVAEIEVEAEPEVEAAAEIEVEAEPEIKPAAKIEVGAEPEVEPAAEIEVEAEPEIEAVAEIEVEADANTSTNRRTVKLLPGMTSAVSRPAKTTRSSKKEHQNRAEVSVGEISRTYESKSSVNIENLKEKQLIDNNAESVKVNAQGNLDKPIYVYANKFSVEAERKIERNGGKAFVIDDSADKDKKH